MERDKGEEGVRKTLLTEFLCLLTHKHIFHLKVLLQYSHSLIVSPRLILATPRAARKKAHVTGSVPVAQEEMTLLGNISH